MALSPGSKLGPYEIESSLGAGGMGEVYRARDRKLGREVAIKVLPEAFARNPNSLARFQREAKILASLNHPNIATIHGLEDSGGTYALVMELVEGSTLADRIRQGPIPIDEAMSISKQTCEALEYAHERGIVHRDLKPANVKVTSLDAVKVLDFGLAKALENNGADHATEPDLTNSPTVSDIATRPGVLLGTAVYMSPEQAKGKVVDRRTDVWAFGAVLFEMLTGNRAFPGETVTDILAAVIRAEPDWAQLPADTPPSIHALLRRCLQKDLRQRLQAIGDARIVIDEVLSGAHVSAGGTADAIPQARSRQWLPWVVAGLMSLFALLALLYHQQRPIPAEPVRFEISLPEKQTSAGISAISPDGSKLAMIATGPDGVARLWLRSLDALKPQLLDGTGGIYGYPFWSPDSKFIAFFAQEKLKKIAASGGPAEVICDATRVWGGAWNGSGKIIFGTDTGTMQVTAAGGSPVFITSGGFSVTPSFLPDGRHFVYLRATVGAGTRVVGIYLGSVDTKPEEQPTKPLLPDYTFVAFAPSSRPGLGYLLFVRGADAVGVVGTLMAQPFNTRNFEIVGDAIPVAEQVSNTSLSASNSGVLVYVRGEQEVPGSVDRGNIRGKLTWFDSAGKILGSFGEAQLYRTLALSPDEKRVAFDGPNPQTPEGANIWLYEFGRELATRFTFGSDTNPIWSADGSHIAFASITTGRPVSDLYRKASNLAGKDDLVFGSDQNKTPTSWSPDGQFVLYQADSKPAQLWVVPVEAGAASKPVQLDPSPFNQSMGRFSPDGHSIVYVSDESGRDEIYVRSFDVSPGIGSAASGQNTVGKWLVSKNGGTSPLWRRDGKELFFLSLDGTAMATDINTVRGFSAGIPKSLFKVPTGVVFWDVSADGKRFLMPAPSAASAAVPFTVALNWQADLKK